MQAETLASVLQEDKTHVFTAPPSLEQKLTEVAHLYTEAECLLKRAERINSEIPIPLINELRYAGSHISRCFLENAPDKKDEEIQKTKNHCERAIFDAYEIMLIWYLDNFKRFSEQYKGVTLTDIIPDYFNSKKIIREARDFVKQYNRKEERVAYCVHAKEWLEKLEPLWEAYDDAREEIVKKAKKERTGLLLKFSGILLTAVGVGVALYSALK